MSDKFDEIEIDWVQVTLNGGPPCFHIEGKKFCGRAQRWAGHDEMHRYRSLAQALRDVERKTIEEIRGIVKGQHAWHDTLDEDIRERFGLKD